MNTALDARKVCQMVARESALVVLIGEAEPAVADLRRELDPAARVGVPAHVTILYPFMPPDQIDDDVAGRLAGLFQTVAPFEHTFTRTRWFGDEVLWLASDAEAVFRSLIGMVSAAFPEYPPYGGEFDDVVPHLTVADHGPPDAMRAAERVVGAHLPIRAVSRAVTLIVEGVSGHWEIATSFALGGAPPTAQQHRIAPSGR